MKLTQLDPIKIKRVQYYSELGIAGCHYSTVCICGKTIFHPSEEIIVDREVGGKHWISIYFHCLDCEEEWEEELQLEVTITVNAIAGQRPNHRQPKTKA